MKKYILPLIIILCACSGAYSYPVLSAYQKAYAMNFEIYRPSGLPAGWYATFDGFPVAQIAENRWVYGQLNYDGAIRPTNILVGSVFPSSVPGLVRVAAVFYDSGLHTNEYMQIRELRINRMGWLNDDGMNTIIAWHTSKPVIRVWLGNRWLRLEPNSGEYVWQVLLRWKGFIIDELRKNHVIFYDEPSDAANMARQWGYIWVGRVILRKLRDYKSDGGGNNVTSLRDNSGSGSNNNNTPDENNNNNNRSRGQWDVD